MSKFESYFLLFSDSIFGNLVIYPKNEFIFLVMRDLNIYAFHKIFLIAALGFSISIMLNYLCGFIAKQIYFAATDTDKHHNYNMLVKSFKKYGSIILLFNIFPLFGLFTPLLSGFVSFGLTRSILICMISKLAYYYILL